MTIPESGRDLWIRLAVLEKWCIVKLESYYTNPDALEAAPRWRLTITPRDAYGGSPIVVEADSAVDAISGAIDRAERVGWPPADSI